MEPPQWFVDAIATPREEGVVAVEDCDIHYVRWGATDCPGLVFVHGGAAHAHWWDHIAPMFTGEYCAVAIDLSGHGDSGRRERYSHELWAAEVMAVAQASGIAPRPIVVAHSMGGWVAIAAAATSGDQLAGIAVLDTPVVAPAPEERAASEGLAFGPLRTYPTFDDALSHFRTVPNQPTSLPYIVDHVARTSLHEVDGGWSWKFDPQIFSFRPVTGETLRDVQPRVALFRSEHGLVTPDIGAYMYEQLGRVAPVIEVPLAYHHVMLDQPIALVTGLRTLLADWEHSRPHRRR